MWACQVHVSIIKQGDSDSDVIICFDIKRSHTVIESYNGVGCTYTVCNELKEKLSNTTKYLITS